MIVPIKKYNNYPTMCGVLQTKKITDVCNNLSFCLLSVKRTEGHYAG